MIYVAGRSAAHGIKAGIVSALGIMGGCIVHILAAVIGLSAVISKSATAFTIIKYLGAGYLIYLGVRCIVNKKKMLVFSSDARKQSYRNIFWQGVITNVLNPKVALFFLAFLPQFIDRDHSSVHWQILFLGMWFNLSGTLVNIFVACLFGKVGSWLGNSPGIVRWQERITGIILIGLGIKVAVSKPS